MDIPRAPLLLLLIISVVGSTASSSPPDPLEATGHGEGEGEHLICYTPSSANEPILFAFFALLLGAIVQLILIRLPPYWPKPPYTVILFVLGIVIQAGSDRADAGVLGHATNGMINMDPHLLLYIFLPPLLFESAFNMTNHIFSRCFKQALLLAGPGVLIATGLTGLLCKYIFHGYEWGWSLAMMFGAMVSATDPVAVVALLSELGAPLSLSTVIEAESLMNDGSAFVVFLILKDFAAGHPLSVGEVADKAARMAFGGPALGIAFGLGFTFILHFCLNDPTIEISLTIVAAYLAFWTAEATSFATSGVLTVVALGVYMGGPGKQALSPEIHEYMHHVWHFLGHLANTVLFVLSGAFTYSLAFSSDSNIGGKDWGYLVVLYILVHITRALTLLFLWPILTTTGYSITKERGIIVWYAGLRGAVGLVLALLVTHESGIDQTQRDRVQFLTAGLVALTILVNGTTAGSLYVALGLAETTAGHRTTLKLSLDYVEENTEKLADKMKKLTFWGSLVQKDISEELDHLKEDRPLLAGEGWKQSLNLDETWQIGINFSMEEDMLRRMVIVWFESQPENAGRRITRVPYVFRHAGTREFTSHYRHEPEAGNRWPPPVLQSYRVSELVQEETRRFCVGDGTAGEPLNRITHASEPISKSQLALEIDIERNRLYKKLHRRSVLHTHVSWYPDFSRVLTTRHVSFLQQILQGKTDQTPQLNRPLLLDVREDLRRIVIVGVQHRYEHWRERRIIESDVFGILHEATLYVEDEDHLWFYKRNGLWQVRGKYDLKSEFFRILDAVGLSDNGCLAVAWNHVKNDLLLSVQGGLSSAQKQPTLQNDDGTSYWESRTDFNGIVLRMVKTLSCCFLDTRSFTNAYLHTRLRLAIHCLMFFRAAHEEVWHEIEEMWGALLSGDDSSDVTLHEESSDLQFCYELGDRLIDTIMHELPHTRAVIASLHEDFIHRLLAVQMREATVHCHSHGLLNEGDSTKMLQAIRHSMENIRMNIPFCGSKARRLKELSAIRGSAERGSGVPEWKSLKEMLHEHEKTPILDKEAFWQIKFVSRLQAQSRRHQNKQSEYQQVVTEMPDGTQRIASVEVDHVECCFDDFKSEERLEHFQDFSDDAEEELDETAEVLPGDAVRLKLRKVKRGVVDMNGALSANFFPDFPPRLRQRIALLQRKGKGVKGWVIDVKEEDGVVLCLVQNNLAEGRPATWYPRSHLTRAGKFLWQDEGRPPVQRVKSLLKTAMQKIWYRVVVDRVRQMVEDKFIGLINPKWLKAKEHQNQRIGAPYPWWGCPVEKDCVEYTAMSIDDEPDWQVSRMGVYLGDVRDLDETGSMIRDRLKQFVIVIPPDHWKTPRVTYVDSHYGDLGLLPSFAHVPFVVGGTEYPTTDHFYQASKYPDIADEYREARLIYRRKIIEARTVELALKLGRDRNGPPIDPEWEKKRDYQMMVALRAKFSLSHGIRKQHQQLLSTGNSIIRCLFHSRTSEMSSKYWGMVKNKDGQVVGENVYGRLLMIIRMEIRIDLNSEPAVAAALAVLAYAAVRVSSFTCDFAVGDRVRVRNSEEAAWQSGVVDSLDPQSGCVKVVVDGSPEGSYWKFVDYDVEVVEYCKSCGWLVKGISRSKAKCSSCGEEVKLPDVIRFFGYHGKYRLLSSCAPIEPPVVYKGNVYHSTDHFYQAQKFPPSQRRKDIINSPTSEEALRLGQDREADPPMRSDWESPISEEEAAKVGPRFLRIKQDLGDSFQVRDKVMYDALRLKFSLQNKLADHHKTLLATGDAYLIHDDHEDNLSATYWGMGPNNTGLNIYGKFLREARTELRKEICQIRLITLAAVIVDRARLDHHGWFAFKS